jgi:predicted dehydrogenase
MISCYSYPKAIGKMTTMNQENLGKIKLVILDPGHFHASLLQKYPLSAVCDTVYVYAPKGVGLSQYLSDIDSYNHRKDNPTHWNEVVYQGDDYLSKMLSEHKGNVVVLAGNNQKKTKYIFESVNAGFNVLSDKPLAINKNDFNLLVKAYQTAKKKGLLIYDLMTERYDILNIVERKLLSNPLVFGRLLKGTPGNPSVSMESVHHFYKNVSGKAVVRPAWYYDVTQQGEGIADVTTHLIDIIDWQCFPDKVIRYPKEVKVLKATHWPTSISLEEFAKSTLNDAFPDYLNKYLNNSKLDVYSNGTIHYSLKGINVGIKVIWNFTPPVGGDDTFSSLKKGTKATLKIVQNKESHFVRQLYIQKKSSVQSAAFEKELSKAIKDLQVAYPFVSLKDCGNGLFLIDVPVANRLGHEVQFSKVATCFFHYLQTHNLPEWEDINTLSKYYITTSAVDKALKGKDK